MKQRIKEYKNCLVEVFDFKYNLSELEARKLIRDYDFNTMLKRCNYIALHDDPEMWADAIYEWSAREELLQM